MSIATWVTFIIDFAVVLAVWRQMSLNDRLYEIVPGFAANCLAILVVNRMARQENVRVLQQFEEVARELRGARKQAAAPQVSYGTGNESA